MSRHFARLMQHRMRRRKGDTAELAAQLAPLEEQDKRAAQQQGAEGQNLAYVESSHPRGAIVVDTGNLALPKDISEGGGTSPWRIEPVVIVIVSLMLLFIAFIAWRITKMRLPKEEDEDGRPKVEETRRRPKAEETRERGDMEIRRIKSASPRISASPCFRVSVSPPSCLSYIGPASLTSPGSSSVPSGDGPGPRPLPPERELVWESSISLNVSSFVASDFRSSSFLSSL